MVSRNLAVFPVTAATAYDTNGFITLDEGLSSGEVTVTELGRVQGLRRRQHPQPPVWREYPLQGEEGGAGAEVNRLVLINSSKYPLILLAGEILKGGKQDRIVSSDRIVPPGGEPVDLSVFCVEPSRWQPVSEKFAPFSQQMAQPSVRRSAVANKSQQRVWSEVRHSQQAMAQSLAAAPGAASGLIALQSTSSYAAVMANPEAAKQVDAVAQPLEKSNGELMRELKRRNAVGVVVAINGSLAWADIFANPTLLEKYWPKLVRSYAAEAVTSPGENAKVSVRAAQMFVDDFTGFHETADVEPHVYRRTEITGGGFKAFRLTSLLPGTGFDIHVSKMSEDTDTPISQE